MEAWPLGVILGEPLRTDRLLCAGGCGRAMLPEGVHEWWNRPWPQRAPAICPRCYRAGGIKIPIRGGRFVRATGISLQGGVAVDWQGWTSRN